MEPDLSSSITMHPHPFQLHTHERPYSPARSSSNTRSPQPQRPHSSRVSLHHDHGDHHGTSTAVEALNDDAEQQPVPRHITQNADAGADVESQARSLRDRNDPFGLKDLIKTKEELKKIKANTSRKRDSLSTSNSGNSSGGVAGKPQGKAKDIHNFYCSQNETIERMLKSVEEHRAAAAHEQGKEQLKFRIAVWGSFAANIVLSILQMYGAISSGSLSLFTTMADSIFDPLSNLMLIMANRAVKRVDTSRFPSGKARLETAGNISFSFLMTSVSLILICFSIEELATRSSADLNKFHLPSVIAVAVAFGTKLALCFYCYGIKDNYSQVDILWQDHRNDLLINGFGVLTSVGGSKLVWWLDAAGAIVLSLLISGIWLRTAFQEFMLLVGVVASVETQQLITYVCLTHSPEAIRGIDTVRVYHSGPRLIAEVDVVMDPEASLRETHDIAEELQFKLENLPDIERAYVHVDYETEHKPEHFYKKDI